MPASAAKPHAHVHAPAHAAPTEDPLALLARAGLRRTTARSRVMSLLMHADAPRSVQDLQPALADLHMDPVTIYRTLHTLVERGLVRQIDLGDRTYRYEYCTSAPLHAHFVCRKCGQAWCMDQKLRDATRQDIARQLGDGFVVETQQVLYQGLCATCTRAARGRD